MIGRIRYAVKPVNTSSVINRNSPRRFTRYRSQYSAGISDLSIAIDACCSYVTCSKEYSLIATWVHLVDWIVARIDVSVKAYRDVDSDLPTI